MDKSVGRKRPAHSTAARLLQKVLSTGWFPPDALARALVMSDDAMQAYLAESKAMPLDRQLCLAQFVIECVPPLARAGQQLRGQVSAAMAYETGMTATHLQPPPSRVWPIG
jgi:hypothetical protein